MGLRRSFKPSNIVHGLKVTDWTTIASNNVMNGNILINTGDGVTFEPDARNATGMSFIAGEKVYVRAKSAVTNAVCTSFGLYIHDGVNFITAIEVQRTPTQNIFYPLSGLYLFTANISNLVIRLRHVYADPATANGKVMQSQDVIGIKVSTLPIEIQNMSNDDLKAFCDAIPWFDGTMAGGKFGGIGGLK